MLKYMQYILPPLFYLGVALAGSAFTAKSMDGWYSSLVKPALTPPGGFIGAVWTTIYILAALSLILFMRAARDKPALLPVVALFVLNGVINAAWSWIFFDRHLLGLAVIDSALIGASVVGMILLVWPYSRTAGILLLPYLAWVCFATYLSYEIYRLNIGG